MNRKFYRDISSPFSRIRLFPVKVSYVIVRILGKSFNLSTQITIPYVRALIKFALYEGFTKKEGGRREGTGDANGAPRTAGRTRGRERDERDEGERKAGGKAMW